MKSLITASANSQLDDLLEDVCAIVQLTQTQYDQAVSHYEAVGNVLGDDVVIRDLSPTIYPQGSMRLHTTVRPWRYLEFDLDLVLELAVSRNARPGEVYDLVAQCLKRNRLYRDRLELLPRCLRINYAGDFHLDIIPAIPDQVQGRTFLLIPDRERKQWKGTNPEGFAVLFDQVCTKQTRILAEKQVKPVPPHLPAYQRPTLKRDVQLWKRHRDVIYKDDAQAPSSIVLTTLAARYFDGDANATDALLVILAGVKNLLASAPLIVMNPSNPTENLTASWPEEQHRKFKTFVTNFHAKLEQLLAQQGTDNITHGLQELFGADIGTRAVKAYAERIEGERRAGRLRAGTIAGGLTTSLGRSTIIARNENFGEN